MQQFGLTSKPMFYLFDQVCGGFSCEKYWIIIKVKSMFHFQVLTLANTMFFYIALHKVDT